MSTLNLSHQHIKRLHASQIEDPSSIVTLDLSHNELKTLDPLCFSGCTMLHEINLSHNSFHSYQEIVKGLSRVSTLRVIILQHSIKSMIYQDIFRTMRWLERIDDIFNPYLIKEQHWLTIEEKNQYDAIQYLQQTLHLSPNHMSHVQIMEPMSKRQFWACLMAFSTLTMDHTFGIQTLSLKHHMPEYRSICIHFLPSLQVLDGVRITMEERENATHRVQEIQKTKEQLDPHTYSSSFTLDMKKIQLAERLTASLTPGGQVEDIDFHTIERRFESIPLLQDFVQSVYIQHETMFPTISILTSFEIAIHFLQIVSIFFELPNITIPQAWFQWLHYLQFEIIVPPFLHLPQTYVTYTIMMLIPLLSICLYHIKLNHSTWIQEYVYQWSQTCVKYMVYILLWTFVSIVGAYGLERVSYEISTIKEVDPMRILYMAIGIQCIFTCIILCCWLNALYFRRHSDIQTWQTVYHRYRKKTALFILTIFYMPVCRILLQTFVCTPDKKTLLFFPSLNCPYGQPVTVYPIIWWINCILSCCYMIGIPIFFAFTIYKKTKQIEYNFDIVQMDMRTKELITLRKTCEEQKDWVAYRDANDQYKEHVKKIDDTYTYAVNQYKSASAYLYASYRRSSKYYKMYQCIEKLVLLVYVTCLQSIITDRIRFYLICGTFSFTFLYHIGFQHPFITRFSNGIAISSYMIHVYNSLLCVPFISMSEWYHVSFMILNYIQGASMVLHMIYMPIRYGYTMRQHKKSVEHHIVNTQSLNVS